MASPTAVPFASTNTTVANATTVAPFAEALKIARRIMFLGVMPTLAVLGTITNSINILVLTHKSMRTSTYLYLAALAVSDMLYLDVNLITGLGFVSEYISPYNLCQSQLYAVLRTCAVHVCTALQCISASIVCTFTIERFIAVCHPMKAFVFCTRRKCVLLIVLCYLWGGLITTPPLLSYRGIVKNGECSKEIFIELIKEKVEAWHYTLILLFAGSIIPFVVILVFNALLIRTVVAAGRSREQMIRGQAITRSRVRPDLVTSSATVGLPRINSTTPTLAPSRPGGSRRTTRMLVIVCVVFLLTRIPTAVIVLNSELIFKIENPTFYYLFNLHHNLQTIFNNIGNLFFSLNASSNFILYSFLSEKFRKTFKEIFLKLAARCAGRKFVVRHAVGRTIRSEAESTAPLGRWTTTTTTTTNNNNNLLSPPTRPTRFRKLSSSSATGSERAGPKLIRPPRVNNCNHRKSPDNRSVSSIRSGDSRF